MKSKPAQAAKRGTTSATVRLAVIGAGAIGIKHAWLLAGIGDARLVAISDVSPAAEKLARELGTACYRDYRQMLTREQPDGVIVATPTATHTEIGIACARQRIHMLMEKPIAQDLDQARRLVDAADNHGVHLLIGHHRRHNPMIQATRRIVAEGEIGRLVAVNVLWMLQKPEDYYNVAWRCELGGGPFLTNLIHDIDNLRYICGEIKRVYAETSSAVRQFTVEDSGAVSLRFAGGAIGSILVSDCTPSYWSYEQSSGENPFYFKTPGNCYLFFGTMGTLSFPAMELIHYPGSAGWQHPLASRQIDSDQRDPLVEQLFHFCRVIRGEEAPRITGEDGLRTLAVVMAILDSGKRGQPVEFDWK
jgi:predicted dehydrogenase